MDTSQPAAQAFGWCELEGPERMIHVARVEARMVRRNDMSPPPELLTVKEPRTLGFGQRLDVRLFHAP